jgi:hypothetical protein
LILIFTFNVHRFCDRIVGNRGKISELLNFWQK